MKNIIYLSICVLCLWLRDKYLSKMQTIVDFMCKALSALRITQICLINNNHFKTIHHSQEHIFFLLLELSFP